MSNPTPYVQVNLTRENGDGSRSETTSWIPVKVKDRDKGGLVKVRKGMTIDLKNEDDTWTRDWIVASVGSEVKDEAPDVRKMIRGHRKNSGDSQPKRERVTV
jgi:hypothetical protein